MISVCMIVCNEGSNIGPALDSILPIANEIIINDTGSDDKTIEIIQPYLDKHSHIKLIRNPWEDSFSLARNQSIAQASKPWIVWLDADDRVPKDSIKGIWDLGASTPDRSFFWRVRNARTDGIKQGPEFYQTRMFPNRPELRFERRVHEQIGPSLIKVDLPRIYVDLEILHTGYENAEAKRKKALRNLRLMEMEKPEYPVDYAHRADALNILRRTPEAIEWYLKAYNLPETKTHSPDLFFSLPATIGGQYMRLGKTDIALKWFKKSDPKNIEGIYQMARCYEEMDKFHIAVNMYFKVLSIEKPVSFVAMEFDACRLYTFHFLLRLLIVMKRHNDACKLIADMTRAYPNNEVLDPYEL